MSWTVYSDGNGTIGSDNRSLTIVSIIDIVVSTITVHP